MSDDVAVRAEGLSRTFATRRRRRRSLRRDRAPVEAVRDVTFTVRRGELLGYIGPNGAGKSTTIKMLTGILAPTAGHATVAGLTPLRDQRTLARRIGVVFGQRSQLWPDLPLGDSFDLLRHIYRVDPARHERRRRELTELLDIGPLLDRPVRQLSLGQRMRGELVAALLHEPEVVFLDEPTIGLDVTSKHAVRLALRELNEATGVTIILTTHDLADIEALCRRLLIIDHGAVIYDGDIEQLRARHGRERVLVVELETPSPPLCIENAETVRVEGPRQWLRFERDRVTAAQVLSRVAASAPVHDMSIEEPEIEDIVRRIYQGSPPPSAR